MGSYMRLVCVCVGGGSRNRAVFIGLVGNHGLSNRSNMDLVGEGVVNFSTGVLYIRGGMGGRVCL